MDIETISKATGLTKDELEKLKKKSNKINYDFQIL